MASPTSAETRVARTDQRIFAATIDQLRVDGIRAVTIEAVAARSGVAKTTIYRRYADRLEMLQAAIAHLVPPLDDVDIDDPRRGLETMLTSAAATVGDYVGYSVAAALIAETDDLAAAQIREQIVEPRLHQLAQLLSRWHAAGLLRSDLDLDMALSSIVGGTGATYVRHGGFPDGWAERLLDYLWPTLAPTDRPTSVDGISPPVRAPRPS